MEQEKFIDLVKRMREAQTIYFKTKNKNMLQKSIILEGLVDQDIQQYYNEQRQNVIQPGLFDDVR